MSTPKIHWSKPYRAVLQPLLSEYTKTKGAAAKALIVDRSVDACKKHWKGDTGLQRKPLPEDIREVSF
jgi:hypothetical protein